MKGKTKEKMKEEMREEMRARFLCRCTQSKKIEEFVLLHALFNLVSGCQGMRSRV